MSKKLLFSLGPKDFRIEFFTVPGHGGSGKDTSNTGVRITHPDSGAVGKSTEERSQLQNKKKAFEKLVNTPEFQRWHKLKCAAVLAGESEIEQMIERRLDKEMKPANLRIEARTEDGWVILSQDN